MQKFAKGLENKIIELQQKLDEKVSLWCFLILLLRSVILMAALLNGQAIIFSSCGFFLPSVFFSLPNLSCCRMDVYHTSTHDAVLVQI